MVHRVICSLSLGDAALCLSLAQTAVAANLTPGRCYWLTEQGQTRKLPRDGALMALLRDRMGH